MKSIRQHINYKYKAIPGLIGALAGILLFAAQVHSANTQPELLEYLSGQTSFYAGERYRLQWKEDRDHWPSVDSYVIRLSLDNKVLKEEHVPHGEIIEYYLAYPDLHLREGIVVDILLTISAVYEGKVQKGVHEQAFKIFARQQNEFEKEILTGEVIGVLDRTDDQSLVRFLEDIGIEFHRLEALNDFSGRWIIASGLDFSNNYSLFDELYTQFQKGTSVLILAPVDGEMALPFYQQEGDFIMSGDGIIRDEGVDWNFATITEDRGHPAVFFRESVVGNAVGLKTSKEGPGSGWLKLSRGEHTMIFCGWNLPALYKRNPAAALFVQHLLRDDGQN